MVGEIRRSICYVPWIYHLRCLTSAFIPATYTQSDSSTSEHIIRQLTTSALVRGYIGSSVIKWCVRTWFPLCFLEKEALCLGTCTVNLSDITQQTP
jgi:hypothetical protein